MGDCMSARDEYYYFIESSTSHQTFAYTCAHASNHIIIKYKYV